MSELETFDKEGLDQARQQALETPPKQGEANHHERFIWPARFDDEMEDVRGNSRSG
ncbi:MAG: hypothetical protein JWN86_3924 [Planctomycetota bacterium]|nr:hypothetical protein [Planctomycetota bacterium]